MRILKMIIVIALSLATNGLVWGDEVKRIDNDTIEITTPVTTTISKILYIRQKQMCEERITSAQDELKQINEKLKLFEGGTK